MKYLFWVLVLLPSLAFSQVPLGSSYTSEFVETFASDGSISAADSTPTYAIYEDTTSTAMLTGSMTLLSGSTNLYYVSLTISGGSGFELGKWYNLVCTATVGGLTQNITKGHFRVMQTERTSGKQPLDDTALSELAQAIPSATPSVIDAIMALYMALTNQVRVSSTEKGFYNSTGTKIYKKVISGAGTGAITEQKAVAGP